MTGCIDLVVSEFNCTLPGIEPICDRLGIPQICLDDVAKKANAEYVKYSYEDRRSISRRDSRYCRKILRHEQRNRANVMKDHGHPDAITA